MNESLRRPTGAAAAPAILAGGCPLPDHSIVPDGAVADMSGIGGRRGQPAPIGACVAIGRGEITRHGRIPLRREN
ncbi:MAG: hypothetical protein QY320_13370 [Gammaproteobacteria bacterium]|nr:MAG: hypothetical protein QY320_13370 [Gammaproteobacteria bacterium]